MYIPSVEQSTNSQKSNQKDKLRARRKTHIDFQPTRSETAEKKKKKKKKKNSPAAARYYPSRNLFCSPACRLHQNEPFSSQPQILDAQPPGYLGISLFRHKRHARTRIGDGLLQFNHRVESDHVSLFSPFRSHH